MTELTPNEVAKMAGVSVRTIYTWIRRGLAGKKLPAKKKQGRIVIKKEDFDRFIEETTTDL
ncbi:MAG: helix-turn-helix domain-containing protein [Bacteroidia bacterium]|nr:helix-turn-helix domain-containing protein [Bacteroidia bacterium]